jgi:Flp pilus assembly protein TadD
MLRHGDTLAAEPFAARVHQFRQVVGSLAMARQMPEAAGIWGTADEELSGLRLVRAGQAREAVATLRRAASQEDVLPFEFGPPQVDKPSHELLGEVLLMLGQPSEARSEFERALTRTPGRSITLLGLARARLASGDTAGSTEVYRQLLHNWQRADTRLPAVREARAAVARVIP